MSGLLQGWESFVPDKRPGGWRRADNAKDKRWVIFGSLAIVVTKR